MKITISYLPDEQQKAKSIMRLLLGFLADSVDKVRESDRHPPFKQFYLTTKISKAQYGSEGNR